MTKRPSPLVGCNTGVRYRGVPYHVQTEDSGIDHPHVITHLFAEGGHIIATRRTSYAQHVGTPAYPDVVHQLIRTQHKEMLVALRDGVYDHLLPKSVPVEVTAPPVAASPPPPTSPAPSARRSPRPTFETAKDSLDEIIIADVVHQLDD